MRRSRKIALGLATSLLAVGSGLWLGQDFIAQRAFDRALDGTVGIDRTAGLADGIHVYVCGSGSPLPDTERAGPCLAVLAGRDAFVFDAGAGSIRKLGRSGFPMERVQAAFLTHLHSDHFDGMGELLLQAWITGTRKAPLPVYGPAGTDRVIGGLREAYAIDAGFRTAHHGAQVAPPAGFGGAPIQVTIPTGRQEAVIFNRNGLKVTAIRVNHAPVDPAYGYRVDYKGRSIAISGDTVASPGFAAAARKVDVMFHEALNDRMIGAIQARLAQRGRAEQAKIMADIPGYHATPEQAAAIAQAAGARSLVLYHLVPAPPARLIERLFLGDAASRYDGDLRLAHDGMRVDLPAGSQAVTFEDAF